MYAGALANDEITFMIFEGPMIIIATFLLTIFHPGIVFRGGNWQRCDFPVFSKSRQQKTRKSWWRKGSSVDSDAGTAVHGDAEKLDDGRVAVLEKEESSPERPSNAMA